MNALIKYGHKNPLMQDDLYDLRGGDRSWVQNAKFSEAYANEKAACEAEERAVSLVRVLHHGFGRYFYSAAIFKFIQDTVQFAGPLLLSRMVIFVSDPKQPTYIGYLLVLGFFVAKLIQTINVNQYFHRCFRTGMNVRAALIGAVYGKALRLSSVSRQELGAGEIINMMTNDTSRIQQMCQFLHLVWSCPLQIVIGLTLLFRAIGPSALAGLSVMVMLVPVQGKLAKKLVSLRQAIVAFTDARVKTMNEILQGIRILKFYGWEDDFEEKVTDIRDQEVDVLRTKAIWNAVNYFVMLTSMLVVSTITFIVYASTTKNMQPQAIFQSMALFGLLWFPISFLPSVLNRVIDTRVSIRRLQDFLGSGELAPEVLLASGGRREVPEHRRGRIDTEDGVFSWDPSQTVPTLADVSLHIEPGTLVVVIGALGSGKSTLLSALLGEVHRLDGEVRLEGSVAYAPQEAWVMNATLKDNILFGHRDAYYAEVAEMGHRASPLHQRYLATLRACALVSDLAILPAGDQTEIGEKGINLSGGQKARVSMARVVFSDSDIVLMDDPLSAVDVHVGKHIFDKCIVNPSVLGGKTRVLVTHHLKFLPQADLVVVVDDGTIQHVGRYDQLMEQGVDFVQIAASFQDADEDSTSEDGDMSSGVDDVAVDPEELARLAASNAQITGVHDSSDADDHEGAIGEGGALVQAEERNVGAVQWKTYRYYLTAAGGVIMLVAMVALLAIGESMRVAQDYWLAKWSADTDASTSEYLPEYVLLGLGNAVGVLLRTVLVAYAGVRASRFLHHHLFRNILRAPTSFFDTTPIGRILSRFSKDIDSVDNQLPGTLQSLGSTLSRVTATLVLVAVVIPWFLIPCVPVVIVYVIVQQYYRHTSRELKRLDSVSRSPIFAHFSETLTGTATIRAYGVTEAFQNDSQRKVDANHRAFICSMSSNRWLSVRLEVLGNLLVVSTALICVFERGKLNPGLVGLVIAYCLRITDSLNWTVRMIAQAEVDNNSVERIMHYTDVEQEAPAENFATQPEAGWPHHGEIVFDRVTMRYRPDLDPALNACTFRVAPGEKVGVVGRTGAGKSSLVLCLFRLVEICGGTITVDGVDISRLGLNDLRRSIAIIPQDPVLFSGSIRHNLDPFDEQDDASLWVALEQSHLAGFVRGLPLGLDAPVTEGGENLSVGQRQLICLARALIRQSRIVVLDEATSAADLRTDALIQTTIREAFRECTVFCIAHRLATIMDSDRILVMSDGSALEFDSPRALLDQPGSIFTGMVDECGAEAAVLRDVAYGRRSLFTPVDQPNPQ